MLTAVLEPGQRQRSAITLNGKLARHLKFFKAPTKERSSRVCVAFSRSGPLKLLERNLIGRQKVIFFREGVQLPAATPCGETGGITAQLVRQSRTRSGQNTRGATDVSQGLKGPLFVWTPREHGGFVCQGRERRRVGIKTLNVAAQVHAETPERSNFGGGLRHRPILQRGNPFRFNRCAVVGQDMTHVTALRTYGLGLRGGQVQVLLLHCVKEEMDIPQMFLKCATVYEGVIEFAAERLQYVFECMVRSSLTHGNDCSMPMKKRWATAGLEVNPCNHTLHTN